MARRGWLLVAIVGLGAGCDRVLGLGDVKKADGGALDGAADAAPWVACSQRPSDALLCADFDDPTQTMPYITVLGQPTPMPAPTPGTDTVVMRGPFTSSPRALWLTSAVAPYAVSATANTPATRVDASFSLQVMNYGAMPTGDLGWFRVSLDNPDGSGDSCYATLVLASDNTHLTLQGDCKQSFPYKPIPLPVTGAWLSVHFSLDLADTNGDGVFADVSINGGPAYHIPFGIHSTNATTPGFTFGLLDSSSMGLTIAFDDILITTKL